MTSREARSGSGTRVLYLALASVAAAVFLAVVAVGIALASTATPEFFSRYHLLERRYVNLGGSAHEGIGCRTCHETNALANGASLVGDYYQSIVATSNQTPRFFRFGPPENDACLSCHEADWAMKAERIERIPHPAHTRVASEERPCVGCHKWTAHFEAYMEKHKEMPFSGVCVAYGCHVGTKTTEQCFDCHHVLHDDAEQWTKKHPVTAKRTGQNACIESCHTVKQCQQCHTTGVVPKFDGLPIEISMKSIEELHVKADWTKTYHGAEALKGRDRCLKCHQDEGECGECHLQRPAFHGSTKSWIGRHKKHTTELDDPRCIECHKQAYCDDCHKQFEEME